MDIAKIPLGERTLGKVVESMVAARPDSPMLQDANTNLTYAQAYGRAMGFGRTLEELGIGWQEPVALMLDSHVENVLCWLGIVLTGRVEVSVNVAYKGDMLAHILEDSGARMIVVEPAYLPRVLEVAARAQQLRAILVHQGAGDAAIPQGSPLVLSEPLAASWDKPGVEPASLQPWDLISLSFTSGTTGRSKAVMCPHAHAFGHATGEGLGRTQPGETRFVVLPQFHIAGRWGGVYNAIARGACAYLPDRFRASTFWQEAKAVNARTSQLVGTMAEFLRLQPPSDDDRNHGLREIAIMPVPKGAQDWAERFGVHLVTCYGSTELGLILDCDELAGESCGRVREGFEVRLVDEHDCEVPAGEVGEMIVRPAVPWTTSIGYANHPDKTAEAWRNGWLHSGDALRRDEAGNYYFVDRVDDALRRRGENISSAEAEYLIAKHPAVKEVAVIGVPSEVHEDDVLAVVVREQASAIDALGLAEDLAETLPYFMVPRYIRFVDALPKTPTEKVQKKVLRTQGIAGAWDAQAAGFDARMAVVKRSTAP